MIAFVSFHFPTGAPPFGGGSPRKPYFFVPHIPTPCERRLIRLIDPLDFQPVPAMFSRGGYFPANSPPPVSIDRRRAGE